MPAAQPVDHHAAEQRPDGGGSGRPTCRLPGTSTTRWRPTLLCGRLTDRPGQRDPAAPDQAIEAAVNDVLSIFITASLLAMPPRRPDRYPGWPASFRTGPVTKLHRSRGFLA